MGTGDRETSSPAAPAAALDQGTFGFFVGAYLLTWLSLAPASFAALGLIGGAPEDYFALAPLAVYGPALSALFASYREGGRPAMRALLSGLRPGKLHPLWYLLALILPGLVFLAGRAVYALVPGNEGGPWVYLPENAQHVVTILFLPLGEEIGWRGYALPRLMARHGATRATVALGLLWGLWHLPMFLAVGMTDVWELLWMLPLFVAGSFMYTWLYRRTGGSLLMAVLLHAGGHLDNPHRAPPDETTPALIFTVAMVALAAALLAFDRRAFEGTSRGMPPREA